MPELLDLPLEIIQRISQNHLPVQQDRLNLLLCCRSFSKKLLKSLYTNPSVRPNLQRRRKLFYSFVERILQGPTLGQAVQTLELHHWSTNPTAQADNEDCIPEVHIAVKAYSQSEDEQVTWMQDIKAGKPDAWLALIIPRLVNLQALWIVFPSVTKCPNHVTRMLARAVSKRPPFHTAPAFPALAEVYVSSSDLDGLTPGLVKSCFSFASLRKVCGWHVGNPRYNQTRNAQDRARDRLAAAPRQSLNLTALDLRGCDHFGCLNNLVWTCNGLKSLHITCRAFVDWRGNGPRQLVIGTPFSVLLSIDKHKHTLESILIDAHDERAQASYSQKVPLQIIQRRHPLARLCLKRGLHGCFVQFTTLKHLHFQLPSLVLLEYVHPKSVPTLHLKDCLSPSLETLHLVMAYPPAKIPWFPSQLLELVTTRENYVPNLHTIELIGEPWKDTDPRGDQVRSACEAANIELAVSQRRGEFYGSGWGNSGCSMILRVRGHERDTKSYSVFSYGLETTRNWVGRKLL
ncbi:hypothetical protein NUU61_003823 [Penicillium alfredii]|uniref:F-box domain-containing protein n=1 Tax=Penicillium alfredii TaxID=1506179 RepID=A0A9W9FJX9_9EURO|nr:uncharacterized protein NUU61_003823 [Penicillium alfredii]KAJ5101601.1 hypothetical protein NUU61_003823 [Penicillium alfredii]